MTGTKKLTSLIRQALNFIRQNGLAGTLARIMSQFDQTKKYSRRTLLKTFPRRFAASNLDSQPDTASINSAAQIPLRTLMDRLHIQGDPAQILSSVRHTLGARKFYRLLIDLFTLEKILSTRIASDTPIIRSSELADIHTNPVNKRILFITSQVPDPQHGGGNRIKNFIKILSENNEIYMATAYRPRQDEAKLESLTQYCHSIHRIPYWRFGGNQNEIRGWLKNLTIDIIHYEWPASLQNYDSGLGRLHIFTYMEVVSLRLFMDMDKYAPLSKPWLDTFAQLISVLRTEIVDTIPLDARIAVTTRDAEFLRSIYPSQEYTILNHGVNLEDFSLSDIDPDPNIITFVGNFGHYPNVDAMTWFFSHVWAAILKAEPGTRIYLIGPDPPDAIMHFAENKQIMVMGGVPDVRPYIQNAAICIAPLISGAGLRGKLVEYAALKRTFVATSIAVTDLAYEDGVDYLKADTAEDFAQKVIILLRDGKLRQKMASSAYEVTQRNYHTRHLVGFLYGLYEYLERKRDQK